MTRNNCRSNCERLYTRRRNWVSHVVAIGVFHVCATTTMKDTNGTIFNAPSVASCLRFWGAGEFRVMVQFTSSNTIIVIIIVFVIGIVSDLH